jgi:hypothetical protein
LCLAGAPRNWVSEIARDELTPAEVEEKLEHLIDQYQQHMKLHRMKVNTGTLETMVTMGAEVLGDLLSSGLVTLLFLENRA